MNHLAVIDPNVLEGGKVTSRHQGEPPDPRLVRDPTQLVPETDIGKLLSQDLLDSAVGRLSPTRVRGPPTAEQQTIHLGVSVVTPIGPKRGKRIRVEYILIIVGIADADPGQDIELEIPRLDVGVERPPLVAPDLEPNPDLRQLKLYRLGNGSAELARRRLEGEGEPPAPFSYRMPGLIQKPPGPFGIEREGRYLRFVRPVLRKEEPRGRSRLPPEEMGV